MTKHTLSSSSRAQGSQKASRTKSLRQRSRRRNENSDVLVSAVISTHLLSNLHHILQRAEYGASKNGMTSQAANFAQLRKVLCMDARSMQDASATGSLDEDIDNFHDPIIGSKVA